MMHQQLISLCFLVMWNQIFAVDIKKAAPLLLGLLKMILMAPASFSG